MNAWKRIRKFDTWESHSETWILMSSSTSILDSIILESFVSIHTDIHTIRLPLSLFTNGFIWHSPPPHSVLRTYIIINEFNSTWRMYNQPYVTSSRKRWNDLMRLLIKLNSSNFYRRCACVGTHIRIAKNQSGLWKCAETNCSCHRFFFVCVCSSFNHLDGTTTFI